MELFVDMSSNYQILDYSPSHNQLLIRSLRNLKRDYNIDILFKMVRVVLMPSLLNGIGISKYDASVNSEKNELLSNYGFRQSKDFKVFVLKNLEGKEYYLNAMALGVFHNKLDILETSIGRYDFGDLGEKVLWYID